MKQEQGTSLEGSSNQMTEGRELVQRRTTELVAMSTQELHKKKFITTLTVVIYAGSLLQLQMLSQFSQLARHRSVMAQ